MTPSRFVRIAQQRFRLLAQPRGLDRDIERELALHLDLLAQEKRAAGLSDEAALREARREFGDVARLTERTRDARGLTWLWDFRQDARYGVRMLRRSPGFTTIASLALALGIGATAAVAGAIALVMARPLPFPQSDRIVTIQGVAADGTLQPRVSARDYFAWRARSGTIEQVGASASGPRSIGPDPGGAPADRVPGQAFTPSLFALLGVRPQAGRLFDETDQPYSRTALVVVISDRLWQRRYGGAANTIGQTMIVDGARRQIVGIMGPEFHYPNDTTELWTPLIFGKDAAGATGRLLSVSARLQPGVTLTQVQNELGSAIRVVPLRETLYGWTRPRLLTLGAAVVLVLILACANVAGLLLARASMRRHEVALRIALGATRTRIVRQLVTESLVLGLGAGTLGVIVAWPGLAGVRAALGPPPGVPRVGTIDLDGWVIAAIVLLSVVSSLVCGLLPAWAEVRAQRGRGRYRLALVTAQFALAQVLLIGAALLSISFLKVNGRVMNLDPRGLLTFEYALRPGEFVRPLGSDEGVPAFQIGPLGSQTIDRVYQRLREVNGAGDVAGISYPPVNSVILPTLAVRVLNSAVGGSDPVAAYFVVTPRLFATLRTPIVRGREFDSRDTASVPWTIVVNETMARLCWPGQDPIGRHLRLDAGADEPVREVVGVVADIPPRRDRPALHPVIYASYLQQPVIYRGPAPGMFGEMTFVMRPTRDKAEVLAAVREGVAEATPNRPILNVGTLERHFDALMTERRTYVAALLSFALAASLLAVIGLFAAMAYDVHGRAGEIAVRKALGARTRDLVAMLGRPAATIVGVGILSGLAIAGLLTRLLATQLWGVTATDPATFASMPVLLLGAALLGCVIPLRRAMAIDPAVRLRSE